MVEAYLSNTEYDRLAGALLSAAPILNIESCLFAGRATEDGIGAALDERCDMWRETIDPNKLGERAFRIVGRTKQ